MARTSTRKRSGKRAAGNRGVPPRAATTPISARSWGGTPQQGIIISIGPPENAGELVDLTHRHIRDWMTFPVTPEAIPVQTGATWNDKRVVGGGERSSFVGPNLDVISFSGLLEPPEYFDPGDTAPTPITRQEGLGKPMIEGLRNVVPRDGAHPGPNYFYMPSDFRDVLKAAEKDGEVMRLVIGEEGWFGLATIRDFTWRYDGPDADEIFYDLTFKQYHVGAYGQKGPEELAGVMAKIGLDRAKHASYTTRNGDTLGRVAIKEFNNREKWQLIARLNMKTILDLWTYNDEASWGPKIKGKAGGWQLGPGQIEQNVRDMVGSDFKFRSGVKLRLRS